jgi:TIR domain
MRFCHDLPMPVPGGTGKTGDDGMRVFVSYRRDDSADVTDRLADTLKQRFGVDHVFLDVDNVEIAADFVEVIGDWIESCDVLLAVIGNQWVKPPEEGGSGDLEDHEDFVRLEIEAAISRAVPVVPVLIHGASMPRPAALPQTLAELPRLNALELTRSHWRADIDRLLGTLETIGLRSGRVVPAPRRPVRRRQLPSRFVLAFGFLAAAIIAAVVIVTTSGGGGGANANTRVHAQDAQATTNAREVATVLDNCPPNSCPPTALAGLGVQIGVGRGEVEVSSGANSIAYTIISRSYSGHIFKLMKTVEGERVYTCTPKGAGGCGSDGTW